MKKKTKRILALIGVILLVGLYLSTLIFALIGSDWAMDMFKICVGFTIGVPVLLYAISLAYRVQNSNREDTYDKHDNL